MSLSLEEIIRMHRSIANAIYSEKEPLTSSELNFLSELKETDWKKIADVLYALCSR